MPESILDENLIDTVKKVFYYGEYSAKDFEQDKVGKKVSFSKYKEELMKILGEQIEEVQVANSEQKSLHIELNTLESADRIFMDLASLGKITDEEFALFLILLDIFAGEEENWLSCSALSERIKEYTDNPEVSDTVVLKKKLESFVSQGYFVSRKNGRNIEYSQIPDIWTKLNKKEFYHFVSLMEFSSNIIPLSMVWKNFKDIVKIYNRKKGYNLCLGVFECRHYHFGQILDENDIWKLITSIYYQKTVSFKEKSGKKKTHIQPYKLIVQEETGEKYLFGIDLEHGNTAVMWNICNITELKTEKSCKLFRLSDEEAERLYHTLLDKSFTGTVLSDGTFQTASLVYTVDFSHEIKKRFPNAQPQHYDSNHDIIKIEVTSLQELKPWLRRNMEKVCIKDCSDDTADQLQAELDEWRTIYGIK